MNGFLSDGCLVLLDRRWDALNIDGAVPSAVTSNPAPVNPTRHLTVGRRLKGGKVMSGRMPPDASPHHPFGSCRCRDPGTFNESIDQPADQRP